MNEAIGLIQPADNPLLDSAESMCPELSFKQRVIGFGVCSGAGWVLSIYAMISFLTLLTGSPETFALVFALSQILTVGGVCFLSGPKSQVRGLKKPGRLSATVLFFGSIAMTIISATAIKIGALVIVFVLLEICAYVWYCVSMFPFGQRMCKGFLNSLCF